jgi:hypothetical protein
MRAVRHDLTILKGVQMTRYNIVHLGRKTYVAKLEKLTVSGLDIRIAGTLDGFIDFAVTLVDGSSLTYSLTCEDARRIIAALGSVVATFKGTVCLSGMRCWRNDPDPHAANRHGFGGSIFCNCA